MLNDIPEILVSPVQHLSLEKVFYDPRMTSDGIGKSLWFPVGDSSGHPSWSPLRRHFFRRRRGFQKDGEGACWQVWAIAHFMMDGWGLNVSVFHKPLILGL